MIVEILKQLPEELVQMYLAMRHQILLRKKGGTYERVDEAVSRRDWYLEYLGTLLKKHSQGWWD